MKVTDAKFELKGKSGTSYMFDVYSVDHQCTTESGIYAFTKRTSDATRKYSHYVIYVGMAECFKDRLCDDHHKAADIKKHGANCICLLAVSDKQKRITIEKDLLGATNTPCNEVNN